MPNEQETVATTRDGTVEIVYASTDQDYDPSDPDFAFTRGLNVRGLPEFLGLYQMASVEGLLALAEAALAGTVFTGGDQVRWAGTDIEGLLVPVDPDGRGNWYAQWFGNPLIEVAQADWEAHIVPGSVQMTLPLSDVPPLTGTVHDLR